MYQVNNAEWWRSEEGIEHKQRLARWISERRAAARISKHNKQKEQEFAAICARYNNRCVACGSDGPLTRDHVRPTALRGSSKSDNIQPLCRRCNEKKHVKIIDYRLNPHPNCVISPSHSQQHT